MKTRKASRASKPRTSSTALRGDWREAALARMRKLIFDADPGMIEERKWKKPSNPGGVPVWSHDGIVCTGETYKQVVKLTFMRGASLPDPTGLFNSGLKGGMRRAIDIHEGETIDARAFKAVVKAAVAQNGAPSKKAARAARTAKPVRLLSGGNPQIPKGEGDAPVRAYIAAMPGWKRASSRRLDDLITRTVPDVRKAVKWNSPFYGVEGQGWFLSFHAFTNYLKVVFFRGSSLRPLPPVGSKSKDVRYFHIHESDSLDEDQLASWIRQAAAIRGWTP